MVNYLARLGWSHGDDEIFSRAQFLQWFNLDHLGRSAAQFDEAKLRWVNAQHLKATDDDGAGPLVASSCAARHRPLTHACRASLRCSRTAATPPSRWPTGRGVLCDVHAHADEKAQHVTDAVKPALATAGDKLADLRLGQGRDRRRDQGGAGRARAQDAATGHAGARAGAGHAQTPSLDAVLELASAKKLSSDCADAENQSIIQGFGRIARLALQANRRRRCRGYSSAGRALAWHARGQRFDPAYLHHQMSRDRNGSKVLTLSSRGLGHHPFTVSTGVRIPVGSPSLQHLARAKR
jgi:hypothetical protein